MGRWPRGGFRPGQSGGLIPDASEFPDLHVTLEGPGDRTTRIYVALRRAVLDGRLACGDRVPATRDLAERLGVARGTVTAAYDRLMAEGFLEPRRGSGTFVTSVRLTDDAAGAGRAAHRGVVRPLEMWGRPEEPPGPRSRRLHDLGMGFPDPELFPLATWRRLVAQQLSRSRLSEATYGGRDSWRLQAEIARLLGRSRSVVAVGADVVVTVGAQQAIDLVARVLVEPGAVVAVEDPGYPAVVRLLETHRANLRGIPIDDEGLVVDALPEDARLVYVTPTHQFPTGVTMSLRRRADLLRWAVAHDAVVVEDDYDSEFGAGRQTAEPLQSLDREGRVVYVGTFSKSLLPALRCGFLIAPRSLQPALREAKRVTTWDGDATTHGALAEFLAEGHHAAHVRRANRIYRARRERLVTGLAELADQLEVVPGSAGLHVCARFRDASVDDRAVVRRAATSGVRLLSLSEHYRQQPARPGLLLGLGGIEAEEIPDALRLVGAALPT